MTQPPPSIPSLRPTRPPRLTGYPTALLLIALAYALGLLASTHNSATFDEGIHIAGGYIHWLLGQPRIHTENGYLSQAIAALPLLLTHPHLPDLKSYAFQHAQPFVLGREFLYYDHNNPDQILLLARATIGLLMAATALTVYAWSRRLFSPAAGIFSLLLFALSPIILAHGFLATSDMTATCFFTLSLASFWWTLQKITPLRFTLTAFALAALFLAKMSAPIILPVLILLVIIRICVPGKIPVQLRCKRVQNVAGDGHETAENARKMAGDSRKWRAIVGFCLLIFQGFAVWLLIWATYGFTFSAFKNSPPDSGQTFWPLNQWGMALENPNTVLNMIAFARGHHLLPESYLYGYAYVVQTGRLSRCFANGVATLSGWWWFYPYVFLLTTPIPILLAILLALLAALQRLRQSSVKAVKIMLYNLAPLLVLVAVYWFLAVLSYRGTGPRHLLPAYPSLCILLGAALSLTLSKKVVTTVATIICVWMAGVSFFIWPHDLSYVNEFAGGPRNGYHHFVDSTVDWGQDLPALAAYLKTLPTGIPVYFSYFGAAEPDSYGIQADALPSFIPRVSEDNPATPQPLLTPGVYCVSVTQLEGLYDAMGRWTPELEKFYQEARKYYPLRAQRLANTNITADERQRLEDLPKQLRHCQMGRLFATLRQRPPDAQAGYSINIYAVSTQELDRALNGPPIYNGPTLK